MRNPRLRIEDMLEAIQRIDKYAVRGRTVFASDELIQIYVVHNLQILGEAACKLTSEYRKQYPDIPWNKVMGMRHILVHDYFQIDLGIVWMVIEKELPKLKAQLLAVLNDEM
ncbi:MAG: DUF86 domain-containing protein [Phycisphaerales bacterium]